MAVTISVIYPRGEGARFDFDYYVGTHLPLVAEKWAGAGLEGAEALRGAGTPDGKEAPFLAIALLRFRSIDDFRAAAGGEAGAAIFRDIPNFTDVRPVVQVNEPIGPDAA